MDRDFSVWYMEDHGYNPGFENMLFGTAAAVDGGFCRYC
jgi:hypothetical protein